MNDPIKDFVDQHRGDFDHLEAPEFDLAGFKSHIQKNTVPAPRVVKLWNRKLWAAAAVVLVLFTTALLFVKLQQNQQVQQIKTVAKKKPVTNQALVKELHQDASNATNPVNLAAAPVKKLRVKSHVAPGMENKDNENYNMLGDSSSASNRLAAVLAISKSERVSYDTFDKLSKTILFDASSNVRLAALGVLEKHQSDHYVSSLLVSALNNQHDPMVQLALVSLLGQMPHVQIDEKLYALVNDPETFGAVKDEAYSVLLKENKL